MDKRKLDSLRQIALHNITVHRFMTMYDHGEYKSLDDCLLEMAITLANINNSLQDRLVEAFSVQQPVMYVIDKDKLTPDVRSKLPPDIQIKE